MNETPDGDKARPAKPDRDQRLKAALKANMAKRKAQARARAGADKTADATDATGAGGNES